MAITRAKKVANKHHLTISKIKQMHVLDRSKVHKPLFWRNEVIKAWCISEEVGNPKFGDETSYWIGIYDEDAPAYAGQIRINFSTYGGMCGYNFEKFFQPEDIECDDDLRIQQKFLAKINYLLEEGIIGE